MPKDILLLAFVDSYINDFRSDVDSGDMGFESGKRGQVGNIFLAHKGLWFLSKGGAIPSQNGEIFQNGFCCSLS